MNYKRLFIPNSILFITIVTKDRKPFLIQNINLLNAAINETKQYYNFEIIAYTIMEDHCHFLLKPENILQYPRIIHSIKYNFKQNVGVATPTYDTNKPIWQNRYYEHSIKDENDLYKHLDYIHYNSVKHYNIPPKDWKQSSFSDFVKNGYYELEWFNLEDKHHINNCNFE